jgi:predicted DNA binding CopG/RHH family protein
VQDIGEKEKKLMKKTVKYTDEPIGDMKIIADFLPPPKDLIFKDDTVKITISLTKESVEFFKKEAEKHHTQYQKMIRNLLDVYAANHQKVS